MDGGAGYPSLHSNFLTTTAISGTQQQKATEGNRPYPSSVYFSPLAHSDGANSFTPINPPVSLTTIDEHFNARVLSAGSKYGIRRGTIDTPIPTDDYYRVPSMVEVEGPGGVKQHLPPDQVFRLDDAEIPAGRLRVLHSSSKREIPMLPINQLLNNIPLSDENNIRVNVFPLPPGSKYRVPPSTNEFPIRSNKYFQLPLHAVVTTVVLGDFDDTTGWVVSILEIYYLNQTLRTHKTKCEKGFPKKVAKVPAGQVVLDTLPVYVKRCQHHMWQRVILEGASVTFSSPPLIIVPAAMTGGRVTGSPPSSHSDK
ncbi:hypothetical protein APHAL10511_000416 [Amanita phalloides]|nr:hypothetical protein APHAL10511_000416 [Amanita phalloides]